MLASCKRRSSLDIDTDSISPNYFEEFFLTHPNITHIFFNGAMEENFFHEYVELAFVSRLLQFKRLPSSSPANASMTFSQKLDAWKAINETCRIKL